MKYMAALEGHFAAKDGPGLVAVGKPVKQKKIERAETVALFNTGSGYKYIQTWQGALDSSR